ncbi:Panacea domain-containing protein [Granulicoccus phenolivorans]|uniref:Panacea domain-containing protein n=1 Tax=Granulicoccus phenolivorans TaxID=266854 RepID=UPI000429C727|nr:type II toxin-antitoxin system antitoxin SocA domain-containing protein [Granulicoccus phenolivorans]
MADVHAVAAYILQQQGPMTTMKLQKLAYYSQAWHLVWDAEPLFQARIEAWMNGPVVRDLYDQHRGNFRVTEWPAGDATALTANERETIDVVLANYGDLAPQTLSEMTHRENPWREARRGLRPTARSDREISQDSMQQYYDAIANS